jgi:hypothetical protein
MKLPFWSLNKEGEKQLVLYHLLDYLMIILTVVCEGENQLVLYLLLDYLMIDSVGLLIFTARVAYQ